MTIKYNVYYAITAQGPWILANDTPLDRNPDGNEFTITGLEHGTLYYVSVVGGRVDENGTFIPLISQPMGPKTVGASDVSIAPVLPFASKTFLPEIQQLADLSHHFIFGVKARDAMEMEFEIDRINWTSFFGHEFLGSIKERSILGNTFNVPYIITNSEMENQFEIDEINWTSEFEHEFLASIKARDAMEMEFEVPYIIDRSSFGHQFGVVFVWVSFSDHDKIELFGEQTDGARTPTGLGPFYSDQFWDRNAISNSYGWQDLDWDWATLDGGETMSGIIMIESFEDWEEM